MQQMISKIDDANELMSRSELKTLELLDKQSKLQAESVENEREFLNIFKNIANNINWNH